MNRLLYIQGSPGGEASKSAQVAAAYLAVLQARPGLISAWIFTRPTCAPSSTRPASRRSTRSVSSRRCSRRTRTAISSVPSRPGSISPAVTAASRLRGRGETPWWVAAPRASATRRAVTGSWWTEPGFHREAGQRARRHPRPTATGPFGHRQRRALHPRPRRAGALSHDGGPPGAAAGRQRTSARSCSACSTMKPGGRSVEERSRPMVLAPLVKPTAAAIHRHQSPTEPTLHAARGLLPIG